MKVVIADDEYIFCEYLKNTVDWDRLKIEQPFIAYNGLDALNLIQELKPEIVLLDINMPNIDGMKVAERLYLENKNIKIIIISGHNEFEYAQKAMKYGVKNFLVKPILTSELETELESLIGEIRENQDTIEHIWQLQQQVSDSEKIIREKIILDMLHGKPIESIEKGINKKEFLNLNFCAEYYMVANIEISMEYEWDMTEKNLWSYVVFNVAQEMFLEYKSCYTLLMQTHVIIILGLARNAKSDKDKMVEQLNVLVKYIDEKFQYTVHIGIGNIVSSLDYISNAYEQATYVLRKFSTTNNRKIISYQQVHNEMLQSREYTVQEKEAFIKAVRKIDMSFVQNNIQFNFKTLRENLVTHDVVLSIVMEYLLVLADIVAEQNMLVSEIFEGNPLRFDKITQIKNIDTLEGYVMKQYQTYMKYRVNGTLGNSIVARIEEYVEIHCGSSDLQIGMIAEEFSLSYHYLCHLYKREREKTLNQYIMDCRMKRAKELLQQGYTNITYLADKVGFKDIGYFGKCFKKYYGVSPSEYIK